MWQPCELLYTCYLLTYDTWRKVLLVLCIPGTKLRHRNRRLANVKLFCVYVRCNVTELKGVRVLTKVSARLKYFQLRCILNWLKNLTFSYTCYYTLFIVFSLLLLTLEKLGTVYVYATVGNFVHVEFFLFFHSIDLVFS